MNRYTSGLGSRRSLPNEAETAQKERNKTEREGGREGGRGKTARAPEQTPSICTEQSGRTCLLPAGAVHQEGDIRPEKIQTVGFQGSFLAKIYRPAVLG